MDRIAELASMEASRPTSAACAQRGPGRTSHSFRKGVSDSLQSSAHFFLPTPPGSKAVKLFSPCNKIVFTALIACVSPKITAETAWFVVSFPPCYGAYSGPEITNAFILPLTQAHDIENARLRSATGGCFGSDDVRP